MHLSFGHGQPERVIYLDEDVYAVVDNSTGEGAPRSEWPADGVYSPIPARAAVGRIVELLGWIGPELWRASRRGHEVCLIEPVANYTPATILLWSADCVEHFARRAEAVDGNVVETLALARAYANTHDFNAKDAKRLADEAEAILGRLRTGGLAAFGRGVVSRAAELDFGGGWLGPAETRYEAGEFATADLRAMQVALMHATRELCRADPLAAGRGAAKWCRRAAARRAVAQEAGDRANDANDAGFFNLLLNPFASGTLARSLPGQVRALQDGDDPEADWQAARLAEYLKRTDDQPLPSPAPW